MCFLLKSKEKELYSFVLGVLLSSIVLLIIKTFNSNFNILELMLGLILLVIGIIISNIIKQKKP